MTSFNVYNINWNNMAAWFIPKHMRKQKYVILVKACLYPLVTLYNLFLNWRVAKVYEMNITSQVCYLRGLLNDRYDYTQRRIYITDAVWHLPSFIFKRAEDKPKFFFKRSENSPQYIFKDGEVGAALLDFVVYVPASIPFDQNEMRSLINSYLVAGPKYTIQLF